MFNKKKSVVTVVTTKQELKMAIQRKDPHIEIRGALVKELKWLQKLSPQKIVPLTTLLATPNLTVRAVEKITGIELATVILSGAISIAIILGILRGYNIEFGMGDTYIKLTTK